MSSAAAVVVNTLPPLARLALAYAPARSRPVWLGALALDARLAKVVREAREPLIGQIRLAWWRERLGEEAPQWPAGEPLLAILAGWRGHHTELSGMVDGWERLLGDPPLSRADMSAAAAGRASGLVAAARVLGHERWTEPAEAMAQDWALADFAAHVSDPIEREVLSALRADSGIPRANLPRDLRPITVLHGMAQANPAGPGSLVRAVRLGILGR